LHGNLEVPLAVSTVVVPTEPQHAPLYRISAGDQLQIRFPDLGAQDFAAVVRPDGYITSPRFGDVPAMGWTPPQLADSLAAIYQQEFRSPRATVQVTGFGPRYFYVFGEVHNPDRYTLDEPHDLVSGVTRAGGFLRSAAQENILILKVGPDGRYGFTVFDMNDLAISRNMPVWLEPNDIIIVPQSAISNAAEFVDTYIMSFIAPADAFLRGRYYWTLATDNLNR
jgi:protein involved in polysaccharide export with SLBB domain